MARSVRAVGRSLGRKATWLRAYGKATFVSADFVLGVLAGSATFVALLVDPELIAGNEVAILLGVGALGVALLAVVLTAMAVLGGISQGYREVLSATSRGVRGAFMPYRTVAVASGTLILGSLVGLLLLKVGNDVSAAAGGALLAALATWATWGTVQLTEITTYHAERQARLEQPPTPEEIAKYSQSRRVS